jgi:hypothetical protein
VGGIEDRMLKQEFRNDEQDKLIDKNGADINALWKEHVKSFGIIGERLEGIKTTQSEQKTDLLFIKNAIKTNGNGNGNGGKPKADAPATAPADAEIKAVKTVDLAVIHYWKIMPVWVKMALGFLLLNNLPAIGLYIKNLVIQAIQLFKPN